MIAALPMYDWPELTTATDAWWQGLAAALRQEGVREVPERLLRGRDEHALWRDPDLLLSQTCGWPLRRLHAADLRPLLIPCHAAPGCAGPTYSSLILVRDDADRPDLESLRGGIAACNGPHSLSGHLALRLVVAPLAHGRPFFRRILWTGSHAASMAAVQAGEADVAAIDCVSHAIARRHRPALVAGLHALACSPLAPALPYVTSRRHGPALVARLRRALLAAFADPALADVRAALLLRGAVTPAPGCYRWVDRMEARIAGAPPLSL